MPFLTYRDRVAHTSFVVGYLFLTLAGVSIPIQLELMPELKTEVSFFLWSILSGFLTVGGATSLVGTLRKKWIGEYLGLPLVFSSLFTFGLLQGNLVGWSIIAAPSISLLWALALFALTRWRQTQYYYQITREARRL